MASSLRANLLLSIRVAVVGFKTGTDNPAGIEDTALLNSDCDRTLAGDPRLVSSGLVLILMSLKVTVGSRRLARRGVSTFDFLSMDFVGDTGFTHWRFGVRLRFRASDASSASLLPRRGDVTNREPRVATCRVFSLFSLKCCVSVGGGRTGEDSGERTKTLRKARYAKMCAGVGAASIRVSSMLYHAREGMQGERCTPMHIEY